MKSKRSRDVFHTFSALSGLILLIPVLFLFYGYNVNMFAEERLMPFGMPDKSTEPETHHMRYSFTEDNANRIRRDFFEYDLTGVPDDIKNLDKAQARIRQLTLSKDTIAGVKINFGKKCRYDSFVKALDICLEEEVGSHYMLGNSLYVINTKEGDWSNGSVGRVGRIDCDPVKNFVPL